MKITINTNSGQYFTSETSSSNDSWDCCDITELVTNFKGLLVAAGYHPVSVDECFNPDVIDAWSLYDPDPHEYEEEEEHPKKTSV